MFNLTLMHWLPKPAAIITEPPIPLSADTIVIMLRKNAPENEIMTVINDLTLDELNTPMQRSHLRFTNYDASPKVSLLRVIHSELACSSKEKQQRYPNLENHLLQRKVEQGVIYQWTISALKKPGCIPENKRERLVDELESYAVDTDNKSDDTTEEMYPLHSHLISMSDYDIVISYIHWLAKKRQSRDFVENGDNIERIKKIISTMSPQEINKPLQFHGITLLHLVASRGLKKMTAYLLEHGANVNAKGGKLMMTPLLYALASPNITDNNIINKTVEILIANGADISATIDGDAELGGVNYVTGETVLDICAKRGNEAMALYFLKNLNMDPHATSRAESRIFIDNLCESHRLEQRMNVCHLL